MWVVEAVFHRLLDAAQFRWPELEQYLPFNGRTEFRILTPEQVGSCSAVRRPMAWRGALPTATAPPVYLQFRALVRAMEAFLTYLNAKNVSMRVEVAIAAGVPRKFDTFEPFVHRDSEAFLMVRPRQAAQHRSAPAALAR